MSEVMKLLVVIYGLKSWANLVHQQSCIGKLVFNYSPQFAFNPPLATCRYYFFFYIFAVVCGIGLCGSESIYTKLQDSHNYYKRPRSHNAHLGNIVHNSNELVAVFGIDDRLSSLIQTMESLCMMPFYLFQLITSYQQLLNKVIPACFQFLKFPHPIFTLSLSSPI